MNNNLKEPHPKYKSDKCEVSGRYFVVGGQMAGCRHILTGLTLLSFFDEMGRPEYPEENLTEKSYMNPKVVGSTFVPSIQVFPSFPRVVIEALYRAN